MSDKIPGLVLFVVGLLSMIGAALNWRIVTHPGKLFNIIFGDRIAHIIYMLVGLALLILGFGQIIGLNWLGI
jgi:hypothetical protein